MLTEENGSPHRGPFGHPYDENYECEFCGRGLVDRWGGVPPAECPSCTNEFRLLNKAGKLEIE